MAYRDDEYNNQIPFGVDVSTSRKPKERGKRAKLAPLPKRKANAVLEAALSAIGDISKDADFEKTLTKISNLSRPVGIEVAAGRLDPNEAGEELLREANLYACTDGVLKNTFDSRATIAIQEGFEVGRRQFDAEKKAGVVIDHPGKLKNPQPSWLPSSDWAQSEDGTIWRATGSKRGEIVVGEWSRVCSALNVIGKVANEHGGDHAVRVEITNALGKRIEDVPCALLEDRPNKTSALLASWGLSLGSAKDRADHVVALLTGARGLKTTRNIKSMGWFQGSFVLPTEVISPDGVGEVSFASAADSSTRFNRLGNIDAWKSGIAAVCVGNPRMIFALSMAFTGPFVQSFRDVAGIFHLNGATSQGKSSLLFSAGSVWGGSDASLSFTHAWNNTANAMVNLAVQHSHTLMCLDEIHSGNPKNIADSIYNLTSGEDRGRLNKDATSKPKQVFHSIVLSSGEMTPEEALAKASLVFTGGMEVRCIGLRIEETNGAAIFDNLHGWAGRAELAGHVNETSKKHYGHAGPEFVRGIVNMGRDAADQVVGGMVERFIAEHCKRGVDGRPAPGEIIRVCKRFAVVAASGEMAIKLGVVSWPAGSAISAASILFKDWLEQRGDQLPRDLSNQLRALGSFLFEHGSTRFSQITQAGMTPLTNNRFGFDFLAPDGKRYFAIPHEALSKIIHGASPTALVKHLDSKGLLLRESHDARLTYRVRTGGQTFRLYCIAQSFVGIGGSTETDDATDYGDAFEDAVTPQKGGSKFKVVK
jgi:putative DNA primase/helicase